MLKDIPGILPQGHDPKVTRHPHYMYMFRYDKSAFGDMSRQLFVDTLIAEGIPAFVAYPAMYRTPVFVNRAFGPHWRSDDPMLPDYSKTSCPEGEEIGETVVWLHHRVLLGDEEDLTEIAEAIEKIRAHSLSAVAVA
jgi:3-amino-5-hydroxybenzoate synthase